MAGRLLAFAPRWLPHLSGAELALQSLLQALQARGWDVRAVTAEAPPPGTPRDATVNGLQVHYARPRPTVARWLAEHAPSAVIGQLAWLGEPLREAKRAGVRVAAYMHARTDLQACSASAATYDVVLACSKALAQEAAPLFGMVELLQPLPGVEARWRVAERRAGTFTATLVNLTPQKGVGLFHELARRLPDVRFLGVRGGWGVQAVEDSPPANVEYLDPTQTIGEVYAETSVLLMPSLAESFGLVAREALANGIPVLASDLSGLREAVAPASDGARLLPMGDIESWVVELRRLQERDAYAVASRDALDASAVWVSEAEDQLSRVERALLGTPRTATASALRATSGPSPLVCDQGGAGPGAFAEALVDVLGFRVVSPAILGASLAAGHPVLVNGLWGDYSALAARYPGRLAMLWHSGWAGSDLMGEGQTLADCLELVRAGRLRLLWLERRDVPPKGAVHIAPVWSPDALRRLAGDDRPSKRPRSVMVAMHGSYPSMAKNILASVVGCLAAEAELHIGATSLSTGKRAAALPYVLAGCRHVVHETLSRAALARLVASMDLLVHPSFSETWPTLPMEAVYSGTPVVISDVVAWSEHLSAWAQERCVVRPVTSTRRMADVVRRLLGSPEDRERLLEEQRSVLDSLAGPCAACAAETFRTLGFPVRDPKE